MVREAFRCWHCGLRVQPHRSNPRLRAGSWLSGRPDPNPHGYCFGYQDGTAVSFDRVSSTSKEVMSQGTPMSRIAGTVIVVIWIGLAALFAVWSTTRSCRYAPRRSATYPIITDTASISRSSTVPRLVVARICESICRLGLVFLQFPESVFKNPVHEPRHWNPL